MSCADRFLPLYFFFYIYIFSRVSTEGSIIRIPVIDLNVVLVNAMHSGLSGIGTYKHITYMEITFMLKARSTRVYCTYCNLKVFSKVSLIRMISWQWKFLASINVFL